MVILNQASLALGFYFIFTPLAFSKTAKIVNFNDAKKFLPSLYQDEPYTLYCGCKFTANKINIESCGYKIHNDEKRARRLEWEHVVPAHAFGQSFKEWREGSDKCVKLGKRFKGRKCARTNKVFSEMEGNLYNLWPEIGELNGLRSNFSFGELGAKNLKYSKFGKCKVLIQDRKFEPMIRAKGRVARTYMYMNQTYPGHGIISDKNKKLFESWDKLYPVDPFECKRAKRILEITGMKNEILKMKCGF